MTKRAITRADILPMEDYRRERKTLRQDIVVMKRDRRVEVGPFATFHFENYRTMWHQVHEMLLVENGGEAQIEDELRAYNPLIPNGRELVATVMFEIEDPTRRAAWLAKLGGVEERMFLDIGGMIARATPEGDVERTREDGKASSVHFMHFALTPAEIAAFRDPSIKVALGIDHREYTHSAGLPPAVREALARDFD